VKIASWRTTVVRVDYDQALPGTHIVLQMRTDEGLEGIAYISKLRNPKGVLSVLEAYLEQLKGQDALDVEAVNFQLRRRRLYNYLSGLEAVAASGIDVALWDIKGKASGLPLYRLLGGFRNRVPTYASWRVEPGDDLDAIARSAARHVENGFTAMKWHGGPLSGERAAAHMRLLRETVGDKVDIMLDVNQLWSAKESIANMRLIESYRPYWFEDPAARDNYVGLRQVTEALDTPTCAGETYQEITPFRELIERRAVDIVMVDLDLGLTGCLKVAHMAEAYGLPIVPHLATEILAHLIAAVPNGLTVEYYPWAVPLFQEVPPVVDGCLVLPDKPGLGLELDEAALKRFAVE
jgi:L-alanine-DL-glutamate epimerase-like enolase superfamily enzyme